MKLKPAITALDVIENTKESLKEGLVPNRIYNDQDIFELEKKQIFAKTWIAVAHESEISVPGDYVVRRIVDDSLIVVRGNDSKIRVFFNYCSHRGMELCRSEEGRTGSFHCPYHGWTYHNTGKLVGVPFDTPIYGEGLEREKFGLLPVPQFDMYNGIIFVNMDKEAASLEEFLGEMKWYLDLMFKWSDDGMEVVGPPQRWIIDANWKIAAENMVGDSYHTPVSHRSLLEVGASSNHSAVNALGPGGNRDGAEVIAGPGALGFAKTEPGSFNGYPKEVVDSLKRNLSAEQFQLMEGDGVAGYYPSRCHVFPNLGFLNGASNLKNDQKTHFLTMRIWQPFGPNKFEAISWALVPKGASAEYKENAFRAYTANFGTSGMAEVDDAEMWTSITRNAKGTMLKDIYQNIQMGLLTDKIDTNWSGPGIAYSSIYTEAGQRFILDYWLKYMTS